MKIAARSTLAGFSIQKLLLFSILFGIVALVPAIIHNQFVTGPLVNAILLIACVSVGPMEAVIIGTVPSTIALTAGLLPLPLAPMVPFIIISNGIFVALFHYLYRSNFLVAVLAASVLKFLFLFLSVSLVMNSLLAQELVQNLAVMMSWPQLVTALIGGILAYGILKVLPTHE